MAALSKCTHEQVLTIATDASIESTQGDVGRGRIEWCCYCGAMRARTPRHLTAWVLPLAGEYDAAFGLGGQAEVVPV